MTDKRKDQKGRNLKDNESQLPDGRYRYRYTDRTGKRKTIYSWKLVKSDTVPAGKRDCLPLREKVHALQKALENGLDPACGNITLNDMWDKYISMKSNLKKTTRLDYIYRYDHFVRARIGERRISTFKYSDIKRFYDELLREGFSVGCIHTIHNLIHPTFTLAVRDEIIRTNPTDNVLAELRKTAGRNARHRHALTLREQELFLDFLKTDRHFRRYYPIMTFFLGTGCRAGEVIGLTWQDIDFENSTISIDHNIVCKFDGRGHKLRTINTPKTEAGKRILPMFREVRQALLQEKARQQRLGIQCCTIIDGYTDFVFLTDNGTIYSNQNLNSTINRMRLQINRQEAETAEKQQRPAAPMRHFSVHNLRHTFCTRLCEVENNIKLIMSIMGHTDVQTTMNIYNEIQEQKQRTAFEELQKKMHIS